MQKNEIEKRPRRRSLFSIVYFFFSLKKKYLLARFAQKPVLPVIGLKEGRDGFRGLVPRGTEAEGAELSLPSLDEIMVHLETERRREWRRC